MIATVVHWLIETACIVFLLGLAVFVAFQHAGAAVENALIHCPIPADVDPRPVPRHRHPHRSPVRPVRPHRHCRARGCRSHQTRLHPLGPRMPRRCLMTHRPQKATTHMTRSRTLAALLVSAVYLSSVVVANWLTTRYGFVPVGFGHLATAGTFAAGAALVVRDFAQDLLGRAGVLLLIVAAAALSYLVADPFIAEASAAAFAVSELLDMTVYTPLRKRARFGDRRWTVAVAAGAVVGAVADSLVFLTIAFGWAAVSGALTGQLIGKAEVAAALILLGVMSRAVFR